MGTIIPHSRKKNIQPAFRAEVRKRGMRTTRVFDSRDAAELWVKEQEDQITQMSPNEKGYLSEIKIHAELISAGFLVVLPAGVRRWDIGFEKEDRIVRVQVKTARIVGNSIRFNSESHSRYGAQDYTGDVEFFWVYVPDLDRCMLIPFDDCGKSETSIRLNAIEKYAIHLPAPTTGLTV